MRRFAPRAVLLLAVLVVILVVAAACGTGHDSQYIQALDAEWHGLHASEREQGCWLISYVGVEQAAATMSWELGLDQDHAVLMLHRHCEWED